MDCFPLIFKIDNIYIYTVQNKENYLNNSIEYIYSFFIF